MNTDCGVIRQVYVQKITDMQPTRVCSVCGANELGYTGSYCTKDEFWLCPECLKKLKKLLNKEDSQ